MTQNINSPALSTGEVEPLLSYVKNRIEGQENILCEIDRLKNDPLTTTSGSEQIFNRYYLQQAIAEYFLKSFDKATLRNCLGSEGMTQKHVKKQLPCHGFTPKTKPKFFYTKEHISGNLPPTDWAKSQEPDDNRSYPDFAIRSPLLGKSHLGELKWLKATQAQKVVSDIYSLVDEAIFYLGAFMGTYQGAIIVIADGSGCDSLEQGYDLINSEIQKRFGRNSGIHLLRLTLS